MVDDILTLIMLMRVVAVVEVALVRVMKMMPHFFQCPCFQCASRCSYVGAHCLC